MAPAATILIATGDGVLADSLRFSLELEGFDAQFCDECSLLPAMTGRQTPGCLVLDQDVFTGMVDAWLFPVPCRHTPIARHGHPGQAYCTSLALAEWLCRTADRIDPARMR